MTIYDILMLGIIVNFVADLLSGILLGITSYKCTNTIEWHVTTSKLEQYTGTRSLWFRLYLFIPFISVSTLLYKVRLVIKCNFGYAEYAEQLIKLDKQLTFKDN